jgi:Calx-beta domain
MFSATRLRAAGFLAAALCTPAGVALAQAEVITVPGQTITHTLPGTSLPVIGPVAVGTPPITVPRTCAGTVFCAGPIEVPPQTIVSVPAVGPIGLTPPITVTASTTDIVAVVDPAVTTLLRIPPTTIPVPNPFGGGPIPVDVCPNYCDVPGASVLDGITGSVTVTACVGATCETQIVPVQFGDTNPGQVCFTRATQQVAEGGGSVTLTVERTGGSFNDAYVSYSTQPGTALSPGDFGARSDQLHWAHGQGGTLSFTVPVVNDTTDESDENFSVVLSGATGATLCQPSAASVTIVDDDNPPAGSLQFSSSAYQVDENGVSVILTVQRTDGTFGTAQADVVFTNGSAGSTDYVNPGPVPVTFSGTTTSQTVTVFISDDAADEPNETFNASLQNVVGASLGTPNAATVTIADDDVPSDDPNPEPFFFVDNPRTPRNVYLASNAVLITGINVAVTPSVSGVSSSAYDVNCDGSTGDGPVSNGQTICVRHMTASTFLTPTSTTLTIGDKSDTFTSTTREPIGDNCPPGQICP